MKSIVFLFAAVLGLSVPATVSAKEVMKQSVPATVLKVVDGDTIKVSARVWLGVNVETMVRINGIDTPEIRGKCPMEKELARKAKDFVKEKLPVGSLVYLSSVQSDKYGGRVVAKVADENKKDIGKQLIQNGLARPYSGKIAKSNWCIIVQPKPRNEEIISVHKGV